MKKQLIFLSLIACSVAVASENSGNIRGIIERKAQTEAYKRAVGNQIYFLWNKMVDKAKEREEQESLSYMAKQAYNGVKTFVSAPVKTTSEFVQPKYDAIKDRVASLELGDKLTRVKDAFVTDFTAPLKAQAKWISETAAFKSVQGKYETAINSDFAQKVSEYANRGTSFVSEHRNKIAGIAAVATVVGISAWLVKKYFEEPANPELVAKCLSGMISNDDKFEQDRAAGRRFGPVMLWGTANGYLAAIWAQNNGYDNKTIKAALKLFNKYKKSQATQQK